MDTTPGWSDLLLTTVLNYQREMLLSPLPQARCLYGINCLIRWYCLKDPECREKLRQPLEGERIQAVPGRTKTQKVSKCSSLEGETWEAAMVQHTEGPGKIDHYDFLQGHTKFKLSHIPTHPFLYGLISMVIHHSAFMAFLLGNSLSSLLGNCAAACFWKLCCPSLSGAEGLHPCWEGSLKILS
jgi:hypothetical protein